MNKYKIFQKFYSYEKKEELIKFIVNKQITTKIYSRILSVAIVIKTDLNFDDVKNLFEEQKKLFDIDRIKNKKTKEVFKYE